MKQTLTHLLLAFLLLCAQTFATAHAVEHAVEEGKGLPSHACEICMAGHDLGSTLVGAPHTSAPLLASFIPHRYHCVDRGALPAPQPRQQSPPDA